MRERPVDLPDAQVLRLVAEDWGPGAVEVEHLPVGFGAYHWRASSRCGPIWFVTYDPFEDRHTAASLEAAYRGATQLAAAGLEFVLAPAPTLTGQLTVPAAGGALSCTPWVVGQSVGDGALDDPTMAEQNLVDLGRLHAVTPPVGIPRWAPMNAARLTAWLRVELAGPWISGPYGERARTAIRDRLPDVGGWAARYVGLAQLAETRPWVATHGETHTANQLRTGDGIVLVDWESLKLAPRERDLSTLVQAGYGDQLGADPLMVDLFDLEWRLSEIDAYGRWFAAPHTGTADDRIAIEGLIEELERGPWW